MRRATGLLMPYHRWSAYRGGTTAGPRYHWFSAGAFARSMEEIRAGRADVEVYVRHEKNRAVAGSVSRCNLFLGDRPDGLYVTMIGDELLTRIRGFALLWGQVELSAGMNFTGKWPAARDDGEVGIHVTEAVLGEVTLTPTGAMGGTRLTILD